jgi:hypothetical protein
MRYIAYKVAVIESERDWGRKIDDYVIALTTEEIEKFRKEFNSKNTSQTAPDWYMQVEGDVIPTNITELEYKYLAEHGYEWLSQLKNHLQDDNSTQI